MLPAEHIGLLLRRGGRDGRSDIGSESRLAPQRRGSGLPYLCALRLIVVRREQQRVARRLGPVLQRRPHGVAATLRNPVLPRLQQQWFSLANVVTRGPPFCARVCERERERGWSSEAGAAMAGTEFEFSRRRRRRSDVAGNAGVVAVGPRYFRGVLKGPVRIWRARDSRRRRQPSDVAFAVGHAGPGTLRSAVTLNRPTP
jgi:hypothetical protein